MTKRNPEDTERIGGHGMPAFPVQNHTPLHETGKIYGGL